MSIEMVKSEAAEQLIEDHLDSCQREIIAETGQSGSGINTNENEAGNQVDVPQPSIIGADNTDIVGIDITNESGSTSLQAVVDNNVPARDVCTRSAHVNIAGHLFPDKNSLLEYCNKFVATLVEGEDLPCEQVDSFTT